MYRDASSISIGKKMMARAVRNRKRGHEWNGFVNEEARPRSWMGKRRVAGERTKEGRGKGRLGEEEDEEKFLHHRAHSGHITWRVSDAYSPTTSTGSRWCHNGWESDMWARTGSPGSYTKTRSHADLRMEALQTSYVSRNSFTSFSTLHQGPLLTGTRVVVTWIHHLVRIKKRKKKKKA